MSVEDLPETDDYSRLAVWGNAVVAVVVAVLAVWWAAGRAVFYEALFRIGPVYQGPTRGVGHDWVVGNTKPALDALIALTHAADVLMGLFILLMVFLHWGAFRRLASRMDRSSGTETGGVAADGGQHSDDGRGERR